MLRRSAVLATGLLTSTVAWAEDKPQLVVYTYDSFVTDWGPGPAIEAGFEATCECDLEFVAAGDGASVLSRLQLEGSATEADVVVGLDNNLMHRAADTGLFAPNGIDANFALPIEWNDATFLPFDWGYFAFVAETSTPAASSFEALAESDLKVVIQDPRSSTPGLGLAYWVKTAYGDDAARIWEGLADNIVTVTPGWSEAYGMFLNGEADAVLSYTTSPAYHLIAEEDDSKTAWTFEEGHYLQVEVAAKLATSDQQELAEAFLQYLVSDAAQTVFPTTNWMYPAVTPNDGLPEGFNSLISPTKALMQSPEDAATLYNTMLDEWQTALTR